MAFLQHIISQVGMLVDPGKIEAVSKWLTQGMQAMLGVYSE